MSLSFIKAGAAVAATALMLSATGAIAAPFLTGQIEYDTKVKANHSNGSPTLQWAEEGQHVTILNAWGSWYYVKLPGPDGWVKKAAVDVFYDDDFDDGPGVKFCFNGPFGYFCVKN